MAVRLISISDLPYNEKTKGTQLRIISERRNILFDIFAEKCIKNRKIMNLFNENNKHHKM